MVCVFAYECHQQQQKLTTNDNSKQQEVLEENGAGKYHESMATRVPSKRTTTTSRVAQAKVANEVGGKQEKEKEKEEGEGEGEEFQDLESNQEREDSLDVKVSIRRLKEEG